MSLLRYTLAIGENVPWPDWLSSAAVAWLVARTDNKLSFASSGASRDFADGMRHYPIAAHPHIANEQHYDLPPEFFSLVLGPRLKYSCALFSHPRTTLAQAEEEALRATARHADLEDGQQILELGCGWGSLSLWMAHHLPRARITAVSNAPAQRAHIESAARRQGLTNLEVVTADMNDLNLDRRFDRIVSVEMFEHMANWIALLERLRGWLTPAGRLFIHVFAHRSCPYRFDAGDETDWIGRHFFTGGIMPSHELLGACARGFTIEGEWRWSGMHYRRTALAWLANLDRRQGEAMPVLRRTYGDQAPLWFRRWRLFFLATAGLFGHADGGAWGVSHYRLAAR